MESKFKWSVSVVCPNGNHDPIKLPHNEPVFIGRSPMTRIVDLRCSRKQVQLTANLETCEVEAIQLGENSSALDGIEMIKNKVYPMNSNSVLQVLTGCYPQKLDIVCNENKHDKKRHKSASEIDNNDKRHGSKHKDKHRRSDSGSSKDSSKKRSLSNDGSEVPFKKPKLESESKNVAAGDKGNNDNEQKHLKDVSSKLALLTSNVKHKSPSKEHSVIDNVAVKSERKHNSSSSPTAATESRWQQFDSLYVYTCKGLKDRRKVAGFDIDGTIITTKSGKVFPTNADDWRLLYKTETLKKFAKLNESGFKIVFFTNQMGVSKGKASIEELKTKFVKVVKEVGVPVQILVATKGGVYRKPCTGMWRYLTKHLNSGLDVDLSQSFYVGDAAGRPKDWMPKKKKDFSSSDRLFALNIGLKFYTPEEYFLGYPTNKFNMPEFDPRMLNPSSDLFDPKTAAVTSSSPEVVVLVGSPASGKSFFAKEYLEPKGYIVVNRDSLKTWQKCVAACTDGLKTGHSVVVDNTNPDAESRARYVDAAKTNGVPCRCFMFTTTIQHAKHNERFREITDKSHQPINDMILNSYKGKYQAPMLSEGFIEIVKVNCVPKFSDKKMEQLYRTFLLEK